MATKIAVKTPTQTARAAVPRKPAPAAKAPVARKVAKAAAPIEIAKPLSGEDIARITQLRRTETPC